MKTYSPSGRLSPYIRCFEVIETTERMTRTLLPDTALAVGFRYAGGAALLEDGAHQLVPDNSITGLRGTARQMHTSAGGGVVIAKIRAACAGVFFGASLHELFGQTQPLEEVAHRRAVVRASYSVLRASNDAQRIAAVEQFFLAILRRWRPDPIVLRALRTIDTASGPVRISALAREAALSQDALEKRFRRSVGTTPKQYASIVRLRRAVESYGPGLSLAQLSLAAGYCDQSHFNRQFRQVTGAAPREFLQAAEYC
jgi:methylphosphotriester-DNA--protein-cysteine methyltransferase